VRLLQQLVETRTRTSLIVSSHGVRLLQSETEYRSVAELRSAIGADAWDAAITIYDDNDRGAPPASGSALSRGMVICPCSMGTVSAIAHGTSRSLIERSADVILKERRKLLVVPRETPLSTIHLNNLLTLSQAGAVVLPAAPGFYHRPASIDDLIDFVVSRILDHFSIVHTIGQRWTGQ
jgi:4-hydroxy-3-polyprenylbenzoate decarboxylase